MPLTAPARPQPVPPAMPGEARPSRACGQDSGPRRRAALLFAAIDAPGAPGAAARRTRAALLCAAGHAAHSHDLPSHAQR